MTLNDSREAETSIFAEANEWWVNFREDDVDAAGKLRFNAWLKKSPEHIRAYMEVAALWSDIPQLAADIEADVETVVAYARSQGNVASIKPSSSARAPETTEAVVARNRTRQRRSWAAIAAVIVACSVLIAWWQLSQTPLYETGIGEQRLFVLTDGSTVELTARSRLRVHMTQEERRIDLLAGQALFKVSKDPARPFIVTSQDVSVRAVGTQFDVHRRSSGTVVTVLEGRVSVAAKAVGTLPDGNERASGDIANGSRIPSDPTQSAVPSLYLSAGEQLTVPEARQGSGAGTAQILQSRPVDATQIATWTERKLNFENEALANVVEEFNRYNRQQIVLADESLADLRISGVFAATKPASLLRFLDQQMQLAVNVSDAQVRVSRRHE